MKLLKWISDWLDRQIRDHIGDDPDEAARWQSIK